MSITPVTARADAPSRERKSQSTTQVRTGESYSFRIQRIIDKMLNYGCHPKGPITRSGNINQGYAFKFNKDGFEILIGLRNLSESDFNSIYKPTAQKDLSQYGEIIYFNHQENLIRAKPSTSGHDCGICRDRLFLNGAVNVLKS